MSYRTRASFSRMSRDGFTAVELLIYLLIGVVAVAAVFQLLIGQNRLYSKQRELMDVRSSLRAAASLLAWELRQPSAEGGDLMAISPTSFTVRSVRATGIICAEHRSLLRFGLISVLGELSATVADSALVFAAGDPGSADDRWKLVDLVAVTSPPAGGVSTCFWADPSIGRGRPIKAEYGDSWSGDVQPDTVVEVVGNMDSVFVGAPFRAFRHVEYGIYQDEGRWWLGERVGGADTYTRLTGPLKPSQEGGLQFTWYDATGNVTTNPTEVALVQVVLRAESIKGVRRASAAASAQEDSIAIRVALRG